DAVAIEVAKMEFAGQPCHSTFKFQLSDGRGPGISFSFKSSERRKTFQRPVSTRKNQMKK
ncbi:MAG TPA: hypothetical protein PKC28_01485, partial [Bdellovibrionales bacterium]|nr:hypothetical protein [Bdellovibrionales bacterium]